MSLRAVEIIQAYIDILGSSAAGRYVVIGYEKQRKAAEVHTGTNRLVQVLYDQGNFSGATFRDKRHEAKARVILTVAENAVGDIAVLNSDTASAAQKMAALTNVQNAAYRANASLDELIGIIWGVTSDARNYDLGLAVGIVRNWQMSSFQKDEPPDQGGLVVVTGRAQISFICEESVDGDEGNQPDALVINSELYVAGAGKYYDSEYEILGSEGQFILTDDGKIILGYPVSIAESTDGTEDIETVSQAAVQVTNP